MKGALLVLLGVAAAAATPAADYSNEISLEMRESQLLSIVEGVRQLSLLLRESWNTGSRAARAFTSQMKPADMARALQENDPIEVSLKALSLDNEMCRSRMICELQTKLTSYSMGDLVYEVIKRKVPKLKKYGVVTARDLGAQSCFEVFPCRASSSPLMDNARHLRSLVEDFCDLSGKSYTSSFCRGIKFAVDRLESL
ncbi:uncharacterized protein LOC122383219 [Amphibalanus amphitrite]|uniref:uncharacterized protein LOC122383219 n=1 Tax=Amphibalanus amphitrite TaxID=1232801 RepID=UPI001C91C8E3|nr:uncharacterized protein LOC122383219 [Amphibalanus amphitrite]